MGPPEMLPSGFILRYLTPSTHSANFVDMPRNPASISQKVAPGPAMEMMMATLLMLPIPTVPATAVANAWKWLNSPL